MDVRQIESKDTYAIRSEVLRPGRPIKTCHFENDQDDNTIHLGAFKENQLVSIASFYLTNNKSFDEDYQYQLRGMATLEKFRGLGNSSALIRTALPLIQKNHVKLLWCNARISAQKFYEKIGFETIGEIFDIPDVGPHILMCYRL